MAIIVDLVNSNISASTKTTNLMSATQLASVPDDDEYLIELYNVSSASGVNVVFQSAADSLMNDSEINRIGTTLDTDQHFVGSMIVSPGSPLQYTLRETAGAATTDVLSRIVATPMSEVVD